jgi:hypothetical protein
MSQKLEANLLFREFNKVEAAIQEWQASDGPVRYFQGNQVKAISAKVDNMIRAFLNFAADEGREVEPKCFGPVVRIDAFAVHYERFVRDAQVENVHPIGSDEMWVAWDHVRESFRIVKPPKPRSIKHLMENEHAPAWQIAKIYGFVDENGDVDIEKVQEEYENPGTHYNPDTWVSPAEIARQKISQAEWDQRKGKRSPLFVLDPEFDPNPVPLAKSPVPSLDELVRLNAPAAQIARLHNIPVEDAEEYLRAAGKGEERFIMPANSDVAFQEQMEGETVGSGPAVAQKSGRKR